MTSKIMNERDNNDSQATFKKENDQLKKQIIKISNEHNELQKKNNILDKKYKLLLKNENKNI